MWSQKTGPYSHILVFKRIIINPPDPATSPTNEHLQASWICLSPIARWIQAVYPATVGIGVGNLKRKGLRDGGEV